MQSPTVCPTGTGQDEKGERTSNEMRRLISAIIALLLVVNLSVTAFAAEWYLEDGDITVSAGDSGQTVSQGSSHRRCG